MTKRLRGWQLEQAKSLPSCPEPSSSSNANQESALATKLLSLWAHGLLSAVAIQEIAHLATLDGANHPELAKLAKAGNFGEQPGNVHRDIVTSFCKHIHISDPFSLQVLCTDPKSSEDVEVQAAMFLPHMMFANLGEYSHEQFSNIFCLSKLESFWSSALATNDDRFHGHPMLSFPNWQKKCVPLFLHADGVEFQSRDTLLAWSWGCLLSTTASLDSHFLISLFPKSCTNEDTWPPMMKYLVWSLLAMMDGKHPSLDPDGRPLQKGSIFHKLQGLDLVPGGYRGILWSIQGDNEMFSNVLKLPHWACHRPCWECDCTQSLDIFPVEKHFKLLRPRLLNLTFVDTEHAIANPKSSHPLFTIPGVTSRIVRHDLLHILWHNGLYSHLLGSILHYMCWKDPPGRPQSVSPARRLGVIFELVQSFYKENNTPTRLTNLKLSMFASLKAPFANHPTLHAKAAESKHLAPALLHVCKAALNPENEVEQHIVRSLEDICKVADIFDKASEFLTDAEFHLASSRAEQFLEDYAWLHEWAEGSGRNLFPKGAFKFHTFFHLVQNSRFLNPKCHWTFMDEDFVGRLSKLTHSISMGVRATKLSMKVSPKYRLLLHLRLQRAGFGSFPDCGE